MTVSHEPVYVFGRGLFTEPRTVVAWRGHPACGKDFVDITELPPRSWKPADVAIKR